MLPDSLLRSTRLKAADEEFVTDIREKGLTMKRCKSLILLQFLFLIIITLVDYHPGTSRIPATDSVCRVVPF